MMYVWFEYFYFLNEFFFLVYDVKLGIRLFDIGIVGYFILEVNELC